MSKVKKDKVIVVRVPSNLLDELKRLEINYTNVMRAALEEAVINVGLSGYPQDVIYSREIRDGVEKVEIRKFRRKNNGEKES
jgi:hypothetical protein